MAHFLISPSYFSPRIYLFWSLFSMSGVSFTCLLILACLFSLKKGALTNWLIDWTLWVCGWDLLTLIFPIGWPVAYLVEQPQSSSFLGLSLWDDQIAGEGFFSLLPGGKGWAASILRAKRENDVGRSQCRSTPRFSVRKPAANRAWCPYSRDPLSFTLQRKILSSSAETGQGNLFSVKEFGRRPKDLTPSLKIFWTSFIYIYSTNIYTTTTLFQVLLNFKNFIVVRTLHVRPTLSADF